MKKNILILEFITSVGGVQTVYQNILPKLCRNFNVYFLDPYKNSFDNEFRKIPGLTVLDMPIKSSSALGWNKSPLEKIKILFKYGFKYFEFFLKLKKLTDQKKIDLLYVSGTKELAFAYLIKKVKKTRYIYHAHGFGKPSDISNLSRLFMNNAAKIITVSNSVKKTMAKACINTDDVSVVYNGLNINNVNALTKNLPLAPKNDVFTLVFFGSIQPKKGIHTLILAINELRTHNKNIILNIYGEVPDSSFSDYEAELHALSKDNSDIHFCGFTNNVYNELLNSDLLVLPSTEESFGMVLIEAMFMEKPVIGSFVGGIPEVIENNVTGLLFEPGNVTDLADKINRIYSNNDVTQIGKLGKQRVLNMFTTDIQCEKIINIINILVEDKR